MTLQCSKCSYSAPCRGKIDLHENTVHSEVKSVICQFPGSIFKTKTTACLKAHQRIHETKLELRKPFPCDFPSCEYRADRARTLKLHVKARHTPGKTRGFQCALCPSKFYSESNLKVHIARHVKERRFNCVHCEFSTHDRKSLLTHVKLLHKNLVTFDCSFPGCCYSSTYRLAVRRHFSQVHSTHPDPTLRRPLACSFPGCNYRANCSSNLKSHITVHHNPQRSQEYVCPLCAKTFYTKQSVRSHVNAVHTLEKCYKCSECRYISSYSANLRRHHRTVHMKKKPPVKWFKCESCDYHTRFQQSLVVHTMTAHTHQRRFQCEKVGCPFQTNYVQVLKKHFLIHEQDPERQFPVMCSFPGCDFRRKITAEMNVHERRHETSKVQFKCKICPSKFSYPDKHSLLFHNYMSHKEIPFKCSDCDYGALHKNALLNHVRERHNSSHQYPQMLQMAKPTESSMVKCRRPEGTWIPLVKNSYQVQEHSTQSFRSTVQQSLWRQLTFDRNPVVLITKVHLKAL